MFCLKNKFLQNLFWCLLGVFVASESLAAIYCSGKVSAVYKWNTMAALSIQITMSDGTITPWINMPTKSDEAMALVALTAVKPVVLYWNAADVTTCSTNAWAQNRVLDGYMVVSN